MMILQYHKTLNMISMMLSQCPISCVWSFLLSTIPIFHLYYSQLSGVVYLGPYQPGVHVHVYMYSCMCIVQCSMMYEGDRCSTVTVDAPPPLRVELHEVTFRSRESEDYLSLSFSLKDINMVLMVRVDVLEQDDNFITHRTLNYTIDEEVYREGSVCVTGLSNSKAPYLVCLRVTYDSGVDSTCSRPGEVEEDIQGDTSCLLPSSTRQVGNRDGAADARAGE